MIDLSYTNKDGLNLYEGFNNGFDYHRDGASEGDGYEHGGYPEIIGETSEYPSSNYKTGDNPDFWGNGNVWEQPSVGPGPGPGPEPEPGLLYLDFGNKRSFYITDFMSPSVTSTLEFNTSKTYNITFEGTKYENLAYHEVVDGESGGPIGYIGNSCMAPIPTASESDTNLPFCLIITLNNGLALAAGNTGAFTVTIEDSELNSEEDAFEIAEGSMGALNFLIGNIFDYEKINLVQLYLSGADIQIIFKQGNYSQTNNIIGVGEGEEISALLSDNINVQTGEVEGTFGYMHVPGNMFAPEIGQIAFKPTELPTEKERLAVYIQYTEEE